MMNDFALLCVTILVQVQAGLGFIQQLEQEIQRLELEESEGKTRPGTSGGGGGKRSFSSPVQEEEEDGEEGKGGRLSALGQLKAQLPVLCMQVGSLSKRACGGFQRGERRREKDREKERERDRKRKRERKRDIGR